MSRFAFLLFLSALVFDVCVATPPYRQEWGYSLFTTTYRNARRDMFVRHYLNLGLAVNYVKYQSDDFEQDYNKIQALLRAETTEACNPSYSPFRRIDDDPLKLRAYMFEMMNTLRHLYPQNYTSIKDYIYFSDLQKRLYLASGEKLFSTAPRIIAAAQVLSYEGFTIVYRLVSRSLFRTYLEVYLEIVTVVNSQSPMIPVIQAALAQMDGIRPLSVSWCPVKPLQATTDFDLRLRGLIRYIRESLQYLEKVDGADPEAIQEKQRLASLLSAVTAKVHAIADARLADYAKIPAASYLGLYHNRTLSLGDRQRFSDIYKIDSPGVHSRYVAIVCGMAVTLQLSTYITMACLAIGNQLLAARVVAEDCLDSPIKLLGIGPQYETKFIAQMEDFLASSGEVTLERQEEFGFLKRLWNGYIYLPQLAN